MIFQPDHSPSLPFINTISTNQDVTKQDLRGSKFQIEDIRLKLSEKKKFSFFQSSRNSKAISLAFPFLSRSSRSSSFCAPFEFPSSPFSSSFSSSSIRPIADFFRERNSVRWGFSRPATLHRGSCPRGMARESVLRLRALFFSILPG